ncbi:hypothetical protein AWR36_005745 [Microbulbifer flavimaris]|uniref:Sulfotransferase family protein n=1 Tax=Microbulbifer flavimaris TaxID=1781068 RepID=A0ABX4HZK8_9GAMM|nr:MULTISPECIES: sulfotransferase [Microbulbifer]KUJ83366.1 hypothetical protein AVO43_05735 [Microbulbifer sp. ZGT114]PCO05521.1 hypothetical protein AWR36_005745 [Microbulbifer flavimaris]
MPELNRVKNRIEQLLQRQDWQEILKIFKREKLSPGLDEELDYYFALANFFLGRLLIAEPILQDLSAKYPERYEAALFLARCKLLKRRSDQAFAIAAKAPKPEKDFYFLDMAGTIFSHTGRPDMALPYLESAASLAAAPTGALSNLAICNLHLGNIDRAKNYFRKIIEIEPHNQRAHWQLAKIQKASDFSHIETMKENIRQRNLEPHNTVFYQFAIAKQLEDLKYWDESFAYYQAASSIVRQRLNYRIDIDERIIDDIIATSERSINSGAILTKHDNKSGEGCIFITGLPRSGTSLLDQILSSHTQISSAGELQTIEAALKEHYSTPHLTGFQIGKAVATEGIDLHKTYLDRTRYLRSNKPWMIDKLPHNYLYLGVIAQQLPEAKLVHITRSPVDSCFAMFKQLFASQYQFSYSLMDLAGYYAAYSKLMNFWRSTLGNRLIEVKYEELVSNPEREIGKLLARLGFDFEESCLSPHKARRPVMTASSHQVREAINTNSVGKYQNFIDHLAPLIDDLERRGIPTQI